jgi:large subunit ribosomal protein L25
MSTNEFALDAKSRTNMGKGASRRLRRELNQVPAIIYGGSKKPEHIMIKHNHLVKSLENEAFYSHIISVNVDGTTEDVILKDLQRHPAKLQIVHADFLRVSSTRKLHVRAPLHFINEDICKGVKLQGGSVYHNMTELEINCLPDDLPEYIEVDLENVEIGQTLHVSDITLPQGVESDTLKHSADHDRSVVTVKQLKTSSGEDLSDEADGEDNETGESES